MNFKNLLLTGLMTASCYAGYNPEGFACTVSNFRFSTFPYGVTITMANPPLYMYQKKSPFYLYQQRDDIKGESADTKLYLQRFEFSFVERNADDTDHVKCTIVSDHIHSTVDVRGMRFPFLRYDGEPIVIEPHQDMVTLALSDFFESSVWADFSLGYGHMRFQWYNALTLIVEMVNVLSTANCGPKIFIDDYLNQ